MKRLKNILLRSRPKNANKGTFGKVLIIAGSDNFPGAAYLCATAAYRVGAGLVTVATTSAVRDALVKKTPEVTYIVLSENNEFHLIEEKIGNYDAILIGPGLGVSDGIKRLVKQLIQMQLPNLVIDADGLNILSGIDNWWKKLGEAVMTPHPGEMSRLTGLSIDEIQNIREKVAKAYAKKWNKIVVLKGANTIIVGPKEEIFVSPFANPVLATAGTGDVLAGMIAGFLAQGLSLFDAAKTGVYMHGFAAEILKEKNGDTGSVASDLLPILPQVIKQIKTG